ncbi:MAG: DUF2268 domain-containing putative Zn-dependent protease [Micropruina sp.]
MTISVFDTASAMTSILDADEAKRPDLVRKMWGPMSGMYRFAPGGVNLMRAHEQNFAFSLDRDTDEVREAIQTLVTADAWSRIERALHRGIEALNDADPETTIPDVKVLLAVGDPSNEHFMNEVRGFSAFGGISGYITVTLWPNATVLDRLEAIVVHELHHNVRYSPGGIVWNPMAVTVGEQVVSEGLADIFAAELYGNKGYTHFVSDVTRNDDAVLAKVVTGLDVTGMQNFTAWIHGDSSARLFGVAPVGLPTGAGYAAGVRLVQAYLDATGRSAAQSLRVPAADIIRVATSELGAVQSAPSTER